MSLANRLSEIDSELDTLGSAQAEISERAHAEWGGKGLDAIDQALMELSAGVTVVDTPSPRPAPALSAPTRSTPDTTTASGSLVAPTSTKVRPEPVIETQAAATSGAAEASVEEAPEALAEVAAPVSEATSAAEVVSPPTRGASDSLFPDGESGLDTGSSSVGSRPLTMSEPPMSQPPPAEQPETLTDEDPFGGMPAPVQLPPRRPSMMPSSSAPSATPSMPPRHIPARTIRTSAAPPPPPVPTKSLRPRSISPAPGGPLRRPSDTPDPFPAQGRASSRPPRELSADELFGGTSLSPPADTPIKLSTPPARAPSVAPATTPPAAEGDDFELMFDDDMLEIDMDDADEVV